jgi:ABC-type antimicrobial peptide transport system permease subunit
VPVRRQSTLVVALALLVAASLAVTFLSSALAGLAPARLAARIDIAAALKSE